MILQKTTSQESNFTDGLHIQQFLHIGVVTWNLFGSIPPTGSVKKVLQNLIKKRFTQDPDILCIATQQCERSLGMSFFCEDKSQWQNLLIQSTDDYQLVESETLQGLHTALLVRKDLANCFTLQKKSVLRAGTCNLLGNKGAVNLEINLLGQNLQFINCHLAPHQNECQHRNEVLLRIINNMVDTDKRTEVIFCGDLNYRIDMQKKDYLENTKHMKNTDVVMHYSKMLDDDQLVNQEILKQQFLPFYKEAPIVFPPTYKLAVDSPRYNETRIPGWTDRIFSRKGRMKQIFYDSDYDAYGSDHRPVLAGFKLTLQEGLSIFPEQFMAVGTSNHCQLI